MYPLSAGLVIENRELWDELRGPLQETSIRLLFELAEVPPDWSAFLERIERVRPDLILLDVTQLRQPLEEIVRNIRSTAAEPAVFALHTTAAPEAILSALRAGASEYLYPPFSTELRAALERLSHARGKRMESSRRGGKTLGFVSAKGGCGATTLACQTAVELARMSAGRVLLADLDFQAGLIGFLAKTKSPYSVADAVDNVQRLDQSYWRALISNGIPNLEIISAPTAPSAKDLANRPLKQVVAFIRGQYDWNVIDLGRNLNAATLGLADQIDEMYLITTHELPALHQAKQMVGYLINGGYPQDNLRLVLNRTPKRMDVTLDELGEMLGLPIFATIDDDYQALQDAYAEGRLLDGAGTLRRGIAALAAKITGIKQEKKKFSLFG